jgi:hypothetical protein
MASWEKFPPPLYSIVTGFFPEVSPKQSWATDPRPLLVCGTARDDETGIYFCRIAYGTSSRHDRAHADDLYIANMSLLNQLNLKRPTRFVISVGAQMAILPWTREFFQPWTSYPTPILSHIPEDMEKYVGYTLTELSDLPQF